MCTDLAYPIDSTGGEVVFVRRVCCLTQGCLYWRVMVAIAFSSEETLIVGGRDVWKWVARISCVGICVMNFWG